MSLILLNLSFNIVVVNMLKAPINNLWSGVSDSIIDPSVLSNPADAHNVSCLEFVVEMFIHKALLNMGWVLSTLSC